MSQNPSFYTAAARYYEAIFPYREKVYSFLKEHLSSEMNNVLDLGCGTGHYTGRFSADGIQSYGIDLDSEMIRHAKERYRSATFHVLDMLSLTQLNQSFDSAFAIGNVISHLSKEQLSSFLETLASVLSPGAHWIFQVVNWDYLLTLSEYQFPEKHVGSESVSFLRNYQNISEESADFSIELRSKSQILFQETQQLYPIRSQDYIDLHSQANFSLSAQYSDYDASPFCPKLHTGNILVFTCLPKH